MDSSGDRAETYGYCGEAGYNKFFHVAILLEAALAG
jgi:hypothetical protein